MGNRIGTAIIKFMSIVVIFLSILACGTDYDWDTPDTPANQKGFENHFGFAVPESVSDLYYFADGMGFDPLYMLGFKTDQDTIDKIVSELKLEQGDPGFGTEYLTQDVPWWDDEDIENLTPYWKTNQDETYFWLFWYNPTSQRAYYLEFGL
ncbi:MAG: hypothetical protein GY832_15125 [Chloroflexi bacterium]|nr:hypothetical protein [Chloroflexota bacterium]